MITIDQQVIIVDRRPVLAPPRVHAAKISPPTVQTDITTRITQKRDVRPQSSIAFSATDQRSMRRGLTEPRASTDFLLTSPSEDQKDGHQEWRGCPGRLGRPDHLQPFLTVRAARPDPAVPRCRAHRVHARRRPDVAPVVRRLSWPPVASKNTWLGARDALDKAFSSVAHVPPIRPGRS
jgi:hypothetical protein